MGDAGAGTGTGRLVVSMVVIVLVLGALEAQQLEHLTADVAGILLLVIAHDQPGGVVGLADARQRGVAASAGDDARVVAGRDQGGALASAERANQRLQHVTRKGVGGCEKFKKRYQNSPMEHKY